MKTTFTILVSSLLLSGSLPNQALAADAAIDLVQVGKDLTRPDGIVVHITKRVGTSIEGIRITKPSPSGSKITISADTGTLQPGFNQNTVRLILHHATIEVKRLDGETTKMTDDRMSIVL